MHAAVIKPRFVRKSGTALHVGIQFHGLRHNPGSQDWWKIVIVRAGMHSIISGIEDNNVGGLNVACMDIVVSPCLSIGSNTSKDVLFRFWF